MFMRIVRTRTGSPRMMSFWVFVRRYSSNKQKAGVGRYARKGYLMSLAKGEIKEYRRLTDQSAKRIRKESVWRLKGSWGWKIFWKRREVEGEGRKDLKGNDMKDSTEKFLRGKKWKIKKVFFVWKEIEEKILVEWI